MFFTIESDNGKPLEHVKIPAQTRVLFMNFDLYWVSSFNFLKKCPNLEILVADKQCGNLNGLEYCPKLRKIRIRTMLFETTLEPLRNLTQLTHLRIRFQWGLDSLEPLSNCTHLQVLELSNHHPGYHRIESLDPLREMKDLKVLDLEGHNISDLEPISGLTSLQHLDLNSNCLRDLRPLSGLHRLQFLDIGNNGLESFQVLTNFYRLKDLNIDGNKIIRSELRYIPSSAVTFFREKPSIRDDRIRETIRLEKTKRLKEIFYKFYIVKIQRLWMYKFWHEEDSDGYTRACRYYCNKNVEYDKKLKAKTKE